MDNNQEKTTVNVIEPYDECVKIETDEEGFVQTMTRKGNFYSIKTIVSGNNSSVIPNYMNNPAPQIIHEMTGNLVSADQIIANLKKRLNQENIRAENNYQMYSDEFDLKMALIKRLIADGLVDEATIVNLHETLKTDMENKQKAPSV